MNKLHRQVTYLHFINILSVVSTTMIIRYRVCIGDCLIQNRNTLRYNKWHSCLLFWMCQVKLRAHRPTTLTAVLSRCTANLDAMANKKVSSAKQKRTSILRSSNPKQDHYADGGISDQNIRLDLEVKTDIGQYLAVGCLPHGHEWLLICDQEIISRVSLHEA
jgi:hypothetical protein